MFVEHGCLNEKFHLEIVYFSFDSFRQRGDRPIITSIQ